MQEKSVNAPKPVIVARSAAIHRDAANPAMDCGPSCRNDGGNNPHHDHTPHRPTPSHQPVIVARSAAIHRDAAKPRDEWPPFVPQ